MINYAITAKILIFLHYLIYSLGFNNWVLGFDSFNDISRFLQLYFSVTI